VATAAVTLGVSKKWVDNVLSHHRVPGVVQKTQGIVRRVSPAGLLALEVALGLVRAFRMPVASALELGGQLIAVAGAQIELPGMPAFRISANLSAVAAALDLRLERAVETTPTPKRGRPRSK